KALFPGRPLPQWERCAAAQSSTGLFMTTTARRSTLSRWMRFFDHTRIGRSRTKILANFIKSGTEASGRGQTAEAAHRVIALLHPLMFLFDRIIQMGISAMLAFAAQDVANGAWVAVVAIGGDPCWLVANRLQGLLEKRFSRR